MDKGNKWRDKEFNARWSVGEGRRNKGGRKELRGDGFFILTRGEKGFWGSLEYWIECNLQWNLQCTGGLQRFWARRARISIDILGLGATSRQGGWFWGGVLRSKLKEASGTIRFRLEL
jgi:hypothetical protein